MDLILITWFCSGFYISTTLATWSERGTFGDMFGAVNSLFSGLAFAGVITAIILQMKELKLQRTELKLTRNEIRGQKEQSEIQNQTLKLQQFENTFFQLLRFHNEIVELIDSGIGNGKHLESW